MKSRCHHQPQPAGGTAGALLLICSTCPHLCAPCRKILHCARYTDAAIDAQKIATRHKADNRSKLVPKGSHRLLHKRSCVVKLTRGESCAYQQTEKNLAKPQTLHAIFELNFGLNDVE